MDAIVDTSRPSVAPLALRTSSANRVDFAFLVHTLLRQKGLIAAVLVGGLVATLLVLLLVPSRYKATASILLPPRQEDAFGSDTRHPPSSMEDAQLVESQLELLSSSRVASRVVKEIQAGGIADLANGDARNHNVQLADASPVPALPAPSATPDQVDKILRGLRVERQGHSYVVEVSYTDKSAEKAAKIANAFVNAYMADDLEFRVAAARSANVWLRDRVRDISRDLDELEQNRQKLRAEGHLLAIGNTSLIEKEIAEYTQRLDSVRSQAAEAKAQLKQARALGGDPQQVLSSDVALQSAAIGDYRRKAAEIKHKIGESTAQHGAQHADVLSAKAELANLNKEVEREVGRLIKSREIAYATATGNIKLLEGQVQKLKDSVAKSRVHEIKLAELNREIAVSRDLYAKLLSRYKVTAAHEDAQGSGVRVIAYATPPRRPSYPKKTLVLLLSSMAWLGLGLTLGVRRQLNHRGLRSRADVEEGLGVQCITTLPAIDLSTSGAGDKQGLTGPICRRIDEEDQDGAYGQSIYALKQWIERHDGPASRVVLVVGAHRAAGRSTVAAQLALHAASGGTRTVLVDADLRSRALSSKWSPNAKRTFTDVPATTGESKAATSQVPGTPPNAKCAFTDVPATIGESKAAISQVPGTPLWLCPAPAEGAGHALDILGSRSMKDFFGALREDFDLIIVDTPPMATYIDATALVPYCDCIVVVIKASHTQQCDALALLEQLDPEPETEIGAVLNMTNPRQKD